MPGYPIWLSPIVRQGTMVYNIVQHPLKIATVLDVGTIIILFLLYGINYARFLARLGWRERAK